MVAGARHHGGGGGGHGGGVDWRPARTGVETGDSNSSGGLPLGAEGRG